jgi:hypothetical protein
MNCRDRLDASSLRISCVGTERIFSCALRLCVSAVCIPSGTASAAVTGTVINRTTGAPQAGATVALYKFGQGGMEPVDQAKTGAQGQFTINQDRGGPPLRPDARASTASPTITCCRRARPPPA